MPDPIFSRDLSTLPTGIAPIINYDNSLPTRTKRTIQSFVEERIAA